MMTSEETSKEYIKLLECFSNALREHNSLDITKKDSSRLWTKHFEVYNINCHLEERWFQKKKKTVTAGLYDQRIIYFRQLKICLVIVSTLLE